eukprot:CAMPEP_0172494754 /NCGR_PEP_ID=MMETSP1066-20121228/55572_1 /TAXON_ID=671091 /ORGANISM="Coscinodiscus wailesii, Strain CCMP2513" /LENGTH=113 /DNA_ID=CAMNT_0013265981 /DNA_START=434 /DNA_END=775 /DNA_ORIENTATION=-
MPTKILHGRETARRHVIFNNGANVLIIPSGRDEIHAFDPAVVRGLYQVPGRWRAVADVTYEEHFGAVAVEAVEVAGNVNIDDFAEFEGAVVGYAVADNFVHGGAARFGEAAVV